MTLLHADGFDAQNALVAGGYPLLFGGTSGTTYATGRTGAGSALKALNSTTELGLASPLLTASTTIIVGFAFKNGGTFNGVPNNCGFFTWMSSGSLVGHIRITSSNSAPAGQLTVWNGTLFGGSQLGSAVPLPVPSTGWQYVEIKIVCGSSIKIRQDGVETYSYSGTTGSASIDQVGFPLKDPTYSDSFDWAIDDWYVCNGSGSVNNDFLGDVRILTLLPNGNGSSSQMVGSDLDSTDNYLQVGELPPSTANYVDSGTTGNKDTYAYQDLANNYAIKGVQVHSYAGQVAGGTLKGRAVAKSGATTATGTDQTLGTAPVVYREVFENNPSGSVPWNPLTLNAAEFGWEVRT